MKVSIIVALYNKEEWISQAIESVLNQKYKDWEMIIVDDGSSDKSGIIVDDYAQKDERIKVFHRENQGIAATRYYAYLQSSGEWITVLDADDLWDTSFLINMLEHSEQASTVIADLSYFRGTKYVGIDKVRSEVSIKTIYNDYLQDKEWLNKISVDMERLVGRITRREIIERALCEIMIHKEEIPNNYFEDVVLAPFINLFSDRIVIVESKLYHVRVVENSHSRTKNMGTSQYEQMVAVRIILEYYRKNNYIELFNKILPNYYLVILKIWYFLSREEKLSDEQKKYKELIEKDYQQYYLDYVSCDKGMKNRVVVNLFNKNKWIWKKLMYIYFEKMYILIKTRG